jgi:hypothetical protein
MADIRNMWSWRRSRPFFFMNKNRFKIRPDGKSGDERRIFVCLLIFPMWISVGRQYLKRHEGN